MHMSNCSAAAYRDRPVMRSSMSSLFQFFSNSHMTNHTSPLRRRHSALTCLHGLKFLQCNATDESAPKLASGPVRTEAARFMTLQAAWMSLILHDCLQAINILCWEACRGWHWKATLCLCILTAKTKTVRCTAPVCCARCRHTCTFCLFVIATRSIYDRCSNPLADRTWSQSALKWGLVNCLQMK